MLTNADALRDDVRGSTYIKRSYSLIHSTGENYPFFQSVLYYFVWAESRPARRFEFLDQEFELGDIQRVLQES
jgi:hypothetical protein